MKTTERIYDAMLREYLASHRQMALVSGPRQVGKTKTCRRVGDSLMGRYFLYHMHPFSVAETLHTDLPDPERIVRPPVAKPALNSNCCTRTSAT